MQIVINVKDGSTNKDIAHQLRFQAGLLEGMEPKAASSTENTSGKTAPGKATPTKKTKTVEETFDLDAEDTETEETAEKESWEEEAEEETEAEVLTKDQVAAQLKKYAGGKVKGGTPDKAAAQVKKFHKSGSLHKVAPKDYPALYKAVGGV